MQAALLQQLSEFWLKLNRREQMLALATVAMGILFVIFGAIRGALDYVDSLDRRIETLASDIVNYSFQIAKTRSVDAQYAHMANQHSSAWTETEIMDRLRQELYRLALRVPPTLDEKGIATQISNESGDLVTIPQLRNGTLEQTDEGYREYNIAFQLPATDYRNMLDYVERLQSSPQALRIDGLRFSRSPMDGNVATQFDIARIVVDNVTLDEKGEAEPTVAAEAIPLVAGDFAGEGCEIAASSGFVTASKHSIMISAQQTPGSAFYKRALPAGGVYEMYVDITAKGKARLQIAPGGGAPFPGERELVADGQPHQYRLRFTVPGDGGQRVALNVPQITLDESGTQVYIDNLVLKVLEG
ncbi:MAG: hypothetical protein HYV27_20510 [Candidatus Hydrogenedentes bacterium]|nr:hypothetical protein [Candidatus Hydrogenedentota bacterium]